MAAVSRKSAAYRQQHRENRRQMYVYGSAVPQPDYLPEKQGDLLPHRANRQVRKNRKRALDIDMGYSVFLSFAAICAVLVCVLYLQLQSGIVNRTENISALQEELADLTEANDTAYNAVVDSVNLELVRSKAINEMGMVYAAQGQVVEYASPTGNSVKQYNEIPADGILAKSKSVSD